MIHLAALPGPPGAGPAPSYLSPTGAEIVLLLLGVVAVVSALLVVTTRQLVHAALWLVVTLGAIAGSYLVLTAEFIAWVQVLVYVGAVVALLLFGLLLSATGAALFRTWVLPFEVLSVLLLAALVGAIVLSRTPTAGEEDGGGDDEGEPGSSASAARFGGAG